ncbi:hypothetical protein GCM10008933_38960 [Paenibacillus motobuensis]|uniref:Uncharacterized protein n=1 Tax=Paenibacillus motobuensis TaxID=295324 RepID=A0ABP3IHZ4_9BACL
MFYKTLLRNGQPAWLAKEVYMPSKRWSQLKRGVSNETTDRYFYKNDTCLNLTKHHNVICRKNKLKFTILIK